jgi:signal transduction histidine kinase/DNA-binding response OmpR family regulator
MFRTLLVIVFIFSAWLIVHAANSIPLITLNAGKHDKVTLADSTRILLDLENQYSIESMIRMEDHQFKSIGTEYPKGGFYGWIKMNLQNKGQKTRHEYLNFCSAIDSIWIYKVINGQVIETGFAGGVTRPAHYELKSNFSYHSLSLQPGDSVSYFFKFYFTNQTDPTHLGHISIQPAEMAIQKVIHFQNQASFYLGVMMLFALVSFFLFLLFKEVEFIFFGLLMVSFGFYFCISLGVIQVWFDLASPGMEFRFLTLSISMIVVSATLFIWYFLNIKEKLPTYSNYYIIISGLTAVVPHILKPIISNPFIVGFINNVFLFIWLIFNIIPVFILLKRKDKSARIIIASFSIVVVTALVHISSIFQLGILPHFSNYLFMFGTICYSGVLFYGLFDKINTIKNEKLKFEELDKLKSRFFANISHEFRTPITLVKGPIAQVLLNLNSEKDKILLNTAKKNADRLLDLVNQLLDLSKLESGKMPLEIESFNFTKLLKGIVMSFESLAEGKKLKLGFEAPEKDIYLFVDERKIVKIFYNLLSNAIKFSEEGGMVGVEIIEEDQKVFIEVSDTGKGISAEQLPFIFDRFFQADASKSHEVAGSGIGLALVKELVEIHGGSIVVESEEGKGTLFRLFFKKGKSHFKNEDFVANHLESDTTIFDNDHETEENSSLQSLKAEERLPGEAALENRETILLIEDNVDVRAFIKLNLANFYNILEAENGKEGVKKAFENGPDLIISDVMMPEMDGYEVCKQLKNDPRTDYIPLILLTAKAADVEKIKGLETGADDYLIKPFDTLELQTRVKNLIQVRKQLRKRFSEKSSFQHEVSNLNSIDKMFLEKVIQTVETNLSDELFSVEDLAAAVDMSKVHLNRKLKALTDHSPNKFIQAYRLQKAMELVQAKKGTVSEIAFETGFSSTAYFVKCFREKFGQTPGSFLESTIAK